MKQQNSGERRRFSRVQYRVLGVINVKGCVPIKGEIDNLSLKGAFVRAKPTISIDTPVELEILASSSSSELKLKVDGRVVRTEEYGVAIEFTKMDIESFTYLKDIVAFNAGNLDKINEEFHEFLRERIATIKAEEHEDVQ
ncbi:MAG TPA: PilZ domain-containing protein [Thermodesulforhabdus norvegica]|uniref:PilZ domain-containing protein n=1 Tax=Thermodesulforhabdus norvegica TaxID=39841 RepID=A0A7C1AXF0_9BACT|nr:PilZ domain-containing protein [Deltaproteobacteria bacterium]MBW2069523.1 PilZ domain-containing protein [Deltaproteobacteria bacterium]HDL90551.1 PilZ domain-containing protein [Thermodesulforhabdus norvegica]